MASPSGSKQSRLLWIDAAGIGVCLLASVVGYMALVHPFLQQRSAATGLSREMESRQKKAAELEATVTTIKDRVDVVAQQLTAGAIQLESAGHINKRIAGVTEFFSSCDLHVDDVQTGRVSSGLQYDLVPITIVGRGAYLQCAKLLHGLCSKYPDMSVMHIDLTGSPTERVELEKFRFDLFWYATPSKAAPKKA
jgi:Tfp pilus assembly protein PilO